MTGKSCFYCKEQGHLKRDCPKYQADLAAGKVQQQKPQPKKDEKGGGTGMAGLELVEAGEPQDRNPEWIFSLAAESSSGAGSSDGHLLTEEEKAQLGRTRKAGVGKKKGGVDTANNMPVRRKVLPRKSRVGCLVAVALLLGGLFGSTTAAEQQQPQHHKQNMDSVSRLKPVEGPSVSPGGRRERPRW